MLGLVAGGLWAVGWESTQRLTMCMDTTHSFPVQPDLKVIGSCVHRKWVGPVSSESKTKGWRDFREVSHKPLIMSLPNKCPPLLTSDATYSKDSLRANFCKPSPHWACPLPPLHLRRHVTSLTSATLLMNEQRRWEYWPIMIERNEQKGEIKK